MMPPPLTHARTILAPPPCFPHPPPNNTHQCHHLWSTPIRANRQPYRRSARHTSGQERGDGPVTAHLRVKLRGLILREAKVVGDEVQVSLAVLYATT